MIEALGSVPAPLIAVRTWQPIGVRRRAINAHAVLRAVLFDFGGVILTSPFEASARFESERGLPPGFVRWVDATDPDANAWARLERNELGIDDFAAAFASESRALGHEVDGNEVLALLQPDECVFLDDLGINLEPALR